ncbi:MAG: DUF1501 domain-containing protein, partial [Planctomycetes bacterium]|nr:DUF1501 domain-containing protein [Planctomycetota bacterium]
MDQGVNRLGCAEFRQHLRQIDRRTFVRAGMLGATGLALSDLLRADKLAAQESRPTKRANSVIILWMRGGPSQHETWDPKPEAPAEIRGAFRAIPTKVSGIRICELLPMSARVMDKWSIIRSLTHNDAGHSSGDQICFTGWPAGPNPEHNIAPSCGSIVAKQLQNKSPKMPAYVMIPRLLPGADAGWLGPAYRPFETQADPAADGPFSVPNLQAPEALSVSRLDDRKSLLSSFDGLRRSMDASGQMDAMDEFNQRAWQIITGPEARSAFDLDAEPRKIRERY